ncbi:MAG TPA: heavy metal-binding domain-containing protein [Mycobacteriales bacterium]
MSFTSNLTVAEHHAIRSVGFTPVGQVLGSCVYAVGWTGNWNCGLGYGWGTAGRAGRWSGGSGGFAGGGTPGGGIAGGSYGGFGWGTGMARTVEAPALRDALYAARNAAMERMRAEAAQVGGDGVVAVRLTVAPFQGIAMEFRAIGTAVRADGEVHPSRPFTSDLSGQEFAQLIAAGWVPAALLLGIAVTVRHDDWRSQPASWSWTNQEVVGYTDLTAAARSGARSRLAADTARYGDGAITVVRDMSLRISRRGCAAGHDAHDNVAEAMVVGTAVVPFRHRGGNAPTPPLPVLRLSGRTP